MELCTEDSLDRIDGTDTAERAKIAILSQPVADAGVHLLKLAVILGSAKGRNDRDLTLILVDGTSFGVTRIPGEVIRGCDAASLVCTHINVVLTFAPLGFTNVVKVDQQSIEGLVDVDNDDTVGQSTPGDLDGVSQVIVKVRIGTHRFDGLILGIYEFGVVDTAELDEARGIGAAISFVERPRWALEHDRLESTRRCTGRAANFDKLLAVCWSRIGGVVRVFGFVAGLEQKSGWAEWCGVSTELRSSGGRSRRVGRSASVDDSLSRTRADNVNKTVGSTPIPVLSSRIVNFAVLGIVVINLSLCGCKFAFLFENP